MRKPFSLTFTFEIYFTYSFSLSDITGQVTVNQCSKVANSRLLRVKLGLHNISEIIICIISIGVDK